MARDLELEAEPANALFGERGEATLNTTVTLGAGSGEELQDHSCRLARLLPAPAS